MKLVIAVAAVAVTAMAFSTPIVHGITAEDRIVTVTGAENQCRGRGSNSECTYLVYTESGQTFENRDEIWALKFRSSDWHGQFRAGGEFRIRTVGFRSGFLSWYPNIVDMERLDEDGN